MWGQCIDLPPGFSAIAQPVACQLWPMSGLLILDVYDFDTVITICVLKYCAQLGLGIDHRYAWQILTPFQAASSVTFK